MDWFCNVYYSSATCMLTISNPLSFYIHNKKIKEQGALSKGLTTLHTHKKDLTYT